MTRHLLRRAPRLVSLCLLAGAAIATHAIASPEDDLTEYLQQQEQAKKFTESAFTLPAAPQDADLVSYPTSANATLNYAIDAKSISVTPEGVVRYVSVIRSNQGARNVTFEGVRCETFEYRLYATGRPDGKWAPARVSEWQPIRPYGPTGYQGVLYRDYFCRDKGPLGSPKVIIQGLKYPKALDNIR
ncbi:hypothetical protein PTE30175_04599 [Pandoraea terrae]|uniref:CNP1-like uncharacterized domain-containing protein n=1 Tax=Pandoraea terrae TaxID=1537710 RepID=A0A5E4YRN3_9BURK|nr:CNP1-like family protein [Pandoraea terrae]VVE51157.1 hypothetical protein PTE30175_04599 [Pandoraea terrae]